MAQESTTGVGGVPDEEFQKLREELERQQREVREAHAREMERVSSVTGARERISLVREGLEVNAPPRDDYGFSRAWQVAITKLEESEMWMKKAWELKSNHGFDPE